MTTGPDTLTAKEKDALRLLLRGHDAKSSARELGLSVHTVNERLRDCRRKLGTTSSREAARRLLEAESPDLLEGTPESLGDKPLGDAPQPAPKAGTTASATRRRVGPRPAVILIGVTAMSLVLAALFLPASFVSEGPLAVLAPAATIETVAGAEPASATHGEAVASARAAEHFLDLIDESRWADSYAATGAEFRRLNTLGAWTDVSARLRPPLGKLVTRTMIGNEYVPAPPAGYRLVKFRSAYASGTAQIESISLAWEDGAWKVAGIVIE
jgi:DNA-binding CsgD family transcriptional regulator